MTSPNAVTFNELGRERTGSPPLSALQGIGEAHHRRVDPSSTRPANPWQRLPPTVRRWLWRGAAASTTVLAPPAAYGLTALLLGAVIVNSEREPPPTGVEIYVVTFGVHTDLMVPRRHAVMDWTPWFPPGDFEDPRFGEYLMMGWGNRRFYEEVREWKDLTAGVALSSVLPSPTLMHVSFFPRPQETNQVQRVIVSETGYARLCAHLRSGFRLDEAGRPRLVKGLSYLGYDAFYEGAGGYDAIATCNEWAGQALRSGGIRLGMWTPWAGQIRASLASTRPDREP